MHHASSEVPKIFGRCVAMAQWHVLRHSGTRQGTWLVARLIWHPFGHSETGATRSASRREHGGQGDTRVTYSLVRGTKV